MRERKAETHSDCYRCHFYLELQTHISHCCSAVKTDTYQLIYNLSFCHFPHISSLRPIKTGSFPPTVWWWHQHSFISRFRNTIGWRLSHQEPDQHPPTVKYVRKNSKVRPRQRHWDGSLSNFHPLEDQRLCWGPTHLCSSCLQTEKATDGATGKTKKEHSKNIQTKTCWWYNPIIWTSDWLSEAAEVWDFPCCFYFKRGQRCFHTYCSDTSDQVCFTTK